MEKTKTPGKAPRRDPAAGHHGHAGGPGLCGHGGDPVPPSWRRRTSSSTTPRTWSSSSAPRSARLCFIEMITVSEAGIYGFIMNVVASWAFVLPAAFVLPPPADHGRRHRGPGPGRCRHGGHHGAVELHHHPHLPGLAPGSRWPACWLRCSLPFNLIKGVLNAALALMLYQPVTNALRRSRLLPPPARREPPPQLQPGGRVPGPVPAGDRRFGGAGADRENLREKEHKRRCARPAPAHRLLFLPLLRAA